MAKARRKNRRTRETQALLQVEMAQPRKARSVRVREAELQAAKAGGVCCRADGKKIATFSKKNRRQAEVLRVSLG